MSYVFWCHKPLKLFWTTIAVTREIELRIMEWNIERGQSNFGIDLVLWTTRKLLLLSGRFGRTLKFWLSLYSPTLYIQLYTSFTIEKRYYRQILSDANHWNSLLLLINLGQICRLGLNSKRKELNSIVREHQYAYVTMTSCGIARRSSFAIQVN